MVSFKRKEVPQPEDTAMSLSEVISTGKVHLLHKMEIIVLLSHWTEHSMLWQWTSSKRNRGVGGYPLSLLRGMRYADKLLSGKTPTTEFYDKYEGKIWTVPEITKVISDMAVAASDYKYYPTSIEGKSFLQNITLESFFWNGGMRTKLSLYTHCPFLYFYENGLVLNEDSVEKKTPISKYIFDAVVSLYYAENGLERPSTLKNGAHNKIVTWSDKFAEWYRQNRKRIPVANRNTEIVIRTAETYFHAKRKPIPFGFFFSQRAQEEIIIELEKKTSDIIEEVVVSNEEIHIKELTPTSILSEVADGDLIGTLCRYGMQKNVSIPAFSVDSGTLACFSNFTLRQLLRKWQLGELSPKAKASNDDWRNILNNG